jgi:hypothetical protein
MSVIAMFQQLSPEDDSSSRAISLEYVQPIRRRALVRKLILLALTVVAMGAATASGTDAIRKPMLRFNLGRFGYVGQGKDGPADYTAVGFLSEDLLLVAVNQRFFHGVDLSLRTRPSRP